MRQRDADVKTDTRTYKEKHRRRDLGCYVGDVQCGGTDNTTTRTSTKVKSPHNSQNTRTTMLATTTTTVYDDEDFDVR